MAVATINEAAYGKLLARTLPRVIETEADNERMIAELEKFGHARASTLAGKEKLAELLTLLIPQFEAKQLPPRPCPSRGSASRLDGGTWFAAMRSDSDPWREQRCFRRAEGKALY
jgi:hypothetical protein